MDDLFFAALEVPSDERDAFLEQACVEDPALLEEVRSLLEAHLAADAADFMGEPLGDVAQMTGSKVVSPDPEPEDPPLPLNGHIGNYRLIRELGKGGMGVVYLAERSDDMYKRWVAIKVMKAARFDLERRFETERKALASLSHPNIAQLFDAGITAEGIPYIVMEYVDGEDLETYCDHRKLGIEARVDLFRMICEAVQHAHRNLIVHRDLKPSNIVVTYDGVPKLLDFGIAKLMHDDDPMGVTQSTRLMTPKFASPEQIQDGLISTSTDIYTLGILLYRLLTGHSPYETARRTLLDIDAPIPEPSSVVTRSITYSINGKTVTTSPEAISHARRTIPDRLRKRLRGDLDTVVMRCLQVEPARRYPTVQALSEDLERFREGMPVHARRDSLVYRTGKFIRRHRVAVALGAAAMLILLCSTVIISVLLYQSYEQQRLEVAANEYMRGLFDHIDPENTSDRIRVKSMLDASVAEAREQFAEQPEQLAARLAQAGELYEKLGLYEVAIETQEAALEAQPPPRKDNPYTAQLYHNLGVATFRIGDFDRSEEYYNRALDMRKRLLGEEHLEVAVTLNALSTLKRDQDDLVLAQELCEQALQIFAVELVPGDEDRLAALDNLAIIARRMGDLEKAERLHSGNLQFRRTPGSKSLLANNLNNLALVVWSRFDETGDEAKLEEANGLLGEAIELYRDQYRDPHPILAKALNHHAQILEQMGRYEPSIARFLESVRVYKEVRGHKSPEVADVYNNLGLMMHRRMQQESGTKEDSLYFHQEAEKYYKASLEIRHQLEDHKATQESYTNLAYLFMDLDPEQALPYAMQSMGIARNHLDPENVAYQRAGIVLAKLYNALGEFSKAEPLLRESFEIRQATLEAGHWRVGNAQSVLGECLLLQGRYEEAYPLLLEGYQSLKAAMGDDDSKTIEARERLEQFHALGVTT